MVRALQLRLLEDPVLVRTSFTSWHEILGVGVGADQIGSAQQIAGTDVLFRRITRHREKLHLDYWIGSFDAAAGQLNQPGKAGSVNPGTSIATDPTRAIACQVSSMSATGSGPSSCPNGSAWCSSLPDQWGNAVSRLTDAEVDGLRRLDVEVLAIDARRSAHPAEPGNERILADFFDFS